MRIIGGRDYYDSAAAYGIDPGVVFVRNSQSLTYGEMEELALPPSGVSIHFTEDGPEAEHQRDRAPVVGPDAYYGLNNSGKLHGIAYGVQAMAVVFCGKIYSGLTISAELPHSLSYQSEVFHFWNADKLLAWLAERKLKTTRATSYYARTRGDASDDLEGAFEPRDVPSDVLSKLIERKISILHKQERGSSAWIHNPAKRRLEASGWVANGDGLKEIEFQKAVDPVTAFQELAQWVGGTLASHGPNTVEITDDKIKIAKHGFDKTSFRKPKAHAK